MYEATAPLPPRRRTGRIVLIVVGAVIGACCIAGTTAALVGGALGADKSGDAAAPVLSGLNTPVRDGQFEFVVKRVTCGQQTLVNGWLRAQAKGQFCTVELSVRNIGKEARRFADGLQQALGLDGQRYEADTGAGVVANGNGEAVWDVINPGIAISTVVVYDIPAGASIATLILHDGALSGGAKVAVSVP